MGQEDVQPKAHQASSNVSESKHNVQVVIPGVNNREWLTTSTSSALGLLLNVDVGQEDVKFKVFQASFIVSQSKHNVQVVIVGDNRESLTTIISSALGLTYNVDVGQEDVKLKAFQASFIASQSKHNVQVVMAGFKSEWLTTSTSSALGLNVDK
jgi:predicted amino acid-binding ACT domain protein